MYLSLYRLLSLSLSQSLNLNPLSDPGADLRRLAAMKVPRRHVLGGIPALAGRAHSPRKALGLGFGTFLWRFWQKLYFLSTPFSVRKSSEKHHSDSAGVVGASPTTL